MTPDKKSLCEKLEQLLSHRSIDIPFNRKLQLYGNPHKINWIKDNLHLRNSQSPVFNDIINVINQIIK